MSRERETAAEETTGALPLLVPQTTKSWGFWAVRPSPQNPDHVAIPKTQVESPPFQGEGPNAADLVFGDRSATAAPKAANEVFRGPQIERMARVPIHSEHGDLLFYLGDLDMHVFRNEPNVTSICDHQRWTEANSAGSERLGSFLILIHTHFLGKITLTTSTNARIYSITSDTGWLVAGRHLKNSDMKCIYIDIYIYYLYVYT